MPELFLWTICIGPLETSVLQPPEGMNPAMLDKATSLSGEVYRCAKMVRLLNELRAQGKNKCLETLRTYLAQGGEDGRVIVICRLLFVNPKGWTPPGLGESLPTINTNAQRQFRVFPMALSKNVPFLLVKGYRLGGRGESAQACLKLCEELALLNEDYASQGYEEAARALTQMESFRLLYDPKDLQQMTKMILEQGKEEK